MSSSIVALNARGLAQWAGGRDFLRFIAGGLAAALGPEQRFDVLLPVDTFAVMFPRRVVLLAATLARLARLIPTQPALPRNPPLAELESMARNLEVPYSAQPVADSRAGLAAYALRHRPRVVVPSMTSLGEDFPVPWVGYVYDFQHRHLPGYFAPTTRAKRDWVFGKVLNDAKAVVVNSRAVAEDVERFYPKHRARVFAMPYCPRPTPAWLAADDPTLRQRYAVPQEYFVISNQTWLHKDHITAIRATRQFLDRTGRHDVQVICTGPTIDDRHPKHFDNLLALIRELRLQDSFRFLGYIPKLDQVQLIKNAVAVIQPTLCEGDPGGGAVYDATGLGVRCILSDIKVNLELDSPLGEFFRAGDAEDLASKMEHVLSQAHVRPANDVLLAQAHERLLRFGGVIVQAIEAARA